MSTTTIVILAGAAGGVAWAGVTLAATAWFNRRARRGALSWEEAQAIRDKVLGRQQP